MINFIPGSIMKTVIVALNSKYIHSSLAPWYLKYSCTDYHGEIKVLEYTINDNIDWVLSKIYLEKPDVMAFSCYIWNISYVLKLASKLKKVLPRSVIILGGPEVSFEPEKIMTENKFVDYILCGEGEISFRKLLCSLSGSSNNMSEIHDCDNGGKDDNRLGQIEGLCRRQGDDIIYDGKYCLIDNLDSIPSPYTDEMLAALGNRIVYYEASRGCPFSCTYCISSTFDGVRYFSLDRVKSDISRLINAGVKQVKFVDRTFNANRARAKEIIRYIIENGKGDTNFHFEAAGDLFDDEMLDILSTAKEGLIQFEIGVQTVNEKTFCEIKRKTDVEKIFKNVRRLKSFGNIHLHLDLIAGLPFEDYKSLQDSFNTVYRLRPHQLQLGFLKMLKGSEIRARAENHGYVFSDYPPYEVFCNRYINFDEMTEFKGIEEIFERYYNSGRFTCSLDYVISRYFDSPFQFYREFYLYNLKEGYLDRSIPGKKLYTVFYDFMKNIVSGQELEIINDMLKFDYLSTNNTGDLPDGLVSQAADREMKDRQYEFLKDERNRAVYLPDHRDMELKQLIRYIRFETFSYDIADFAPHEEGHEKRYEQGYELKSKQEEKYNNAIEIKKKPTVILFNYLQKNRVTGIYAYSRVDLL